MTPRQTLDPALPPPYTSPADLTGRTFLGRAPTATPYGDFAPPSEADFLRSQGSQFLQDQQQKAIQRSAAARGTLLNGGTLKALQANAVGNAAQDYGNAFNRALQTYGTNRDTNAQNFGQFNTQFRGDLDVFGANNDVGMGWARMAPPPGATGGGDAMAMGAASPAMGSITRPFDSSGMDYAAAVAAQRAQNAAESDRLRRPMAGPLAGFRRPEQRGALA